MRTDFDLGRDYGAGITVTEDSTDIGGDFASPRRVRRHPQYKRHLAEALRLWEGVIKGNRRHMLAFQEAMTTGDFQHLFSDVIDRSLLGNYMSITPTWQALVRQGTVPDFREANRHYVDGVNAALGRELRSDGSGRPVDELRELEPYPMRYPSDDKYTIRVRKYGRAVGLSWESIINDVLDALRRLPGDLALAARLGEEWAVYNLFFDANGPHASFFTGPAGNIINTANGASADNPPLSIAALQDGFTVLSKQRDSEGEPIQLDMVTLLVPPALEVVANNIVNGTTLRVTTAGGASGQELETANWMNRRLQVVVGNYIPDIAATANGDTSWALFGNPNTAGRPAGELATLRNAVAPRLFVKASNARALGGGETDPMDGDFEHDATAWKVRHNWGVAAMEQNQAVASNGSGT